MYWLHKRLFSQNFLINRQLVHQLIRGSSISSQDQVLEIGPGKGIITQELLASAGKVTAIELDTSFFVQLKSKFGHNNKFSIIQGDFLKVPLPSKPYKVFSNIPFGITGEIVRKLLQSHNPPQDIYLVMQSEAASKFIVHPDSNTLASILYYPYWDIQVTHHFHRTDFFPQPMVDSVLLRIKPRLIPLVSLTHQNLYQDFIAYHFIHDRFAKFVPSQKWIALFNNFLHSPQQIRVTQGAFIKLQSERNSLEKIHRTRTDHNWKKFKKS